ncbi:MAG: alpha/beta fold hydrolase [Thermomicrobiales bacterium]
MTEQEHPRPARRFTIPRATSHELGTLPDLDLHGTGSVAPPVAPRIDDAIQSERPVEWAPSPATDEPTATPAPAPASAPASPRPAASTPRAGGSLTPWRYEADAWRMNRRLTRRQANLMLRMRTARAIPQSLHARFAAMGLPDDVVDETLGSIRSLDAWPDAWIETAQRYLGDFRRQVSAGNQVDGARNQALAGLCYHIAQIVTDEHDRRTATMCRTAAASLYSHALPYVHPTVTRITIPWRAKSLPGYLHLPLDSATDHAYGLIVLLNGASSSKEETLAWAGPFIRAGFAVLAMDSPGTGEAARTPFSTDQDDILDGVFATLAHDPRLDLSQVVVVGISLGGNQALRCAAYDRRIAGVVAVTAPVQPDRWIGRISPLLRSELLAMTPSGDASLPALVEHLDLRPIVEKIACPVLVVGAGHDMVVPPTESQHLAQLLGPLATLDWFSESSHCVYDQIGTWVGDAARWATAVFELQAEFAAAARGANRADVSQAIAAGAREALLAAPPVEPVIEEQDDLTEGARLLDPDEILDDDPDWYRAAPEPQSHETNQRRPRPRR